MMSQLETVSNKQLFNYGFLALPLAFAGLPLYINAPDFYTREIGVSIGLLGVVLLFIRLFDAIQDPLIGYFSDKYADKRYVIMLLGAVLLLVGMATLFTGPASADHAVSWFAISMLLATSGFSIVSINLNMMGGFWFDNPHLRTKVSAWRESLGLIGLLLAAILPTLLAQLVEVTTAFEILVWVFSVLLVVAMGLFSLFYYSLSKDHAINRIKSSKRFSFFPLLFGVHKPFFVISFLSHLAASLPAVMVLFFINDYLQAEQLSGLFLLIYFISGALFMPLWVKLASRIGNKKTWLVAMVLAIVTFMWAATLSQNAVISYGFICLFSGIALGADLALPAAILADRVNQSNSETEATQFYGVLAFLPKLAVAVCSGFAFIALDLIGFKAGDENSEFVLSGIIIIYAVVPCLIKLVAAFCLWSLIGDDDEKFKKTMSTGSNYHA
jgi:GPH family glycoside/pentoside/hexuronide:cation symporter